MDGREPVPLEELRARVHHLDPRQGGGGQVVLGPEAAPVRVRQVGDTALPDDPVGGVRDRGELLGRLGQDVDPVGEHVGVEVAAAVELGRELARRDQQQLVVGVHRDVPVVGDREHVEAGPDVVLDQPVGGRLAVGVRGVRVQLRSAAIHRRGRTGRSRPRTLPGGSACTQPARFVPSPDLGRPPRHPSQAPRGRSVGLARPLPGRLRGQLVGASAVDVEGRRASLGRRAGPAGHRRRPRRAGHQRLRRRGQRLRPGHRLHEHGVGGDLRRPLLAPLLVRHRQLAAAERRSRDAEGVGRRPGLHHPASQGRDVPQRPPGGRRRLQVRVGAGARSQDPELGGQLHLHDQGRQGALPTPGAGADRRRGGRRQHASGDARPARHHVRLRPHPAVHGARAQGGGRPARRRASPTRRSGTARSRSGRTTRRASATCSRGSTTTTGRGSRTSTRSSSGGASTRACSCS